MNPMNKVNIAIGCAIAVIILATLSFFAFATKSNPQKIYHIGVLSGVDIFIPIIDSFKEKMTALGYIEGKNVIYDIQRVNADPAVYEQVARKFSDDHDDLIFVFPTEPTYAVLAATASTSIPIVFVGDIEGTKLVESIQHPGGNITGVRIDAVATAGRRIELLHQIVPNAKRIYVPYDKNYPITAAALSLLHQEAKLLNVTLVELPATSPDDIIADLKARDSRKDIGIDAILTTPNPLVSIPPSWNAIAAFARKHKLVISGNLAGQTDMGALFTLTADYQTFGQFGAVLADKILHGIPAGSIPLETPTALLKVNDAVAKAIGLTLNENFLSMADEIIR
jgi:putative tryptophan/tyrosine transport system substrate-binding protein